MSWPDNLFARKTKRAESTDEVEYILRIGKALADAVSLREMAKLVSCECKLALRADATCLFLSQPDGSLDLSSAENCTQEFLTLWRRIPKDRIQIDLDNPETSYFFGDAKEFTALHPETTDLIARAKRKVLGYSPLVVQRRLIGLLGFSFNSIPTIPTRKDFVLALVNLCAQALERARRFEEDEFQRAKTQFESNAKSEFLSSINHEIRTPIGIARGYSDLLCESAGLTREQRKWALAIRRSTQLVSELVGEVLDMSMIEAHKLKLEKSPFCIHEIIADVRALFLPKAKEAGIDLQFDIGQMPHRVTGDRIRFRQILVNLISNSLKFTLKGSVKVTVEMEGQLLKVWVRDTGVGIDPDQQDCVFEPFAQAGAATKRYFGGTGLGLAISRRLAQQMGGDIALVESVPGVGSTFLFTTRLDIAAAEWTPVPADKGPARLNGIRVLLVDDSEDNRELFSELLRKEGAQVDLAGSGAQGVQLALANEYDAILMDIRMPELSGHEAVAQLRSKGYRKPIVALTALALKHEMERALTEGFNGYITKPIQRSDLIDTVWNMVKGSTFGTTSS